MMSTASVQAGVQLARAPIVVCRKHFLREHKLAPKCARALIDSSLWRFLFRAMIHFCIFMSSLLLCRVWCFSSTLTGRRLLGERLYSSGGTVHQCVCVCADVCSSAWHMRHFIRVGRARATIVIRASRRCQHNRNCPLICFYCDQLNKVPVRKWRGQRLGLV